MEEFEEAEEETEEDEEVTPGLATCDYVTLYSECHYSGEEF